MTDQEAIPLRQAMLRSAAPLNATSRLPNVILAAATDQSDSLSAISNYGRSSVHLAAPGINITTTAKGTNYLGDFDGTSAACPHVAGAIALLAASAPESSAESRKAALLSSVDQIPALRGRLITGGRLNVSRAMAQLTNFSALPIVLSATPANSRAFPENHIRIEFNRPMDTATVESGFRLTPAVAGRFHWSDGDRAVEFIPSTPLLPTNYAALLPGTVADRTGATLDGNYNRTAELSPSRRSKISRSFVSRRSRGPVFAGSPFTDGGSASGRLTVNGGSAFRVKPDR